MTIEFKGWKRILWLGCQKYCPVELIEQLFALKFEKLVVFVQKIKNYRPLCVRFVVLEGEEPFEVRRDIVQQNAVGLSKGVLGDHGRGKFLVLLQVPFHAGIELCKGLSASQLFLFRFIKFIGLKRGVRGPSIELQKKKTHRVFWSYNLIIFNILWGITKTIS